MVVKVLTGLFSVLTFFGSRVFHSIRRLSKLLFGILLGCIIVLVWTSLVEPMLDRMKSDTRVTLPFSEAPYFVFMMTGEPSVSAQSLKGVCSGVFLTSQSILTAAHCLNTITHVSNKQRLNLIHARSHTGQSGQLEEVIISHSYAHPLEDVGVIFLKNPIIPQEAVRAENALLLLEDKGPMIRSGDTGTEKLYTVGRELSHIHESCSASFPVVALKDLTSCGWHNRWTLSHLFSLFSLKNLRCVKSQGKQLCQGDSGSPIIKEYSGKYGRRRILLGISNSIIMQQPEIFMKKQELRCSEILYYVPIKVVSEWLQNTLRSGA